ncbi:3-oxoacyl-[acyl-carrier protein] reductase [Salinibacillus kushneri]|uniref:3-oxoacyl-[acyl-carrier protein] reductase n=1 Tax=Salinibacillus kushneri TaxID=237682 RepID=A0A1H9YER7_9BACI|nr:SDR family oxidoreductase [Salinibacillus kushneri]SES67512.1 3-oxoacyl-[acyl-carrier protein] reductase [Salinibacillus kushneri]
MDFGLKGKSVLVLAASKGLGRATALEFAREGAHVHISSRNPDALEETKKYIQEETGNDHVYATVCDITQPDEIQHLVKNSAQTSGTIDVLINNAGGPPAGTFEAFDDTDWQQAFELNLLSFIRAIREVLPYMKEQRSGRIINFASSSIKQTLNNLILSNTFRAGIVGLSKSLSQELAPYHILINTVGPGRIATDRVTHLDQVNADKQGISVEEQRVRMEKAIPMERYGEPDEFAKAIVFLGSEANTYMTGQSLVIDGGLVKAL